MMLGRVVIGSLVAVALAAKCPKPAGADAFELEKLKGTWYEVGKVQTLGGAIFEGACKCTSLVYTPIGDDGSATVSNICTNKNNGKVTVANATIAPTAPGVFQEKFCGICPAVDYTIVALDGEDYMVEFDCSSTLGILNYCFHVMSRKPSLEDATLTSLKGLMEQYGLNPNNLDWKVTDQDGCWDGVDNVMSLPATIEV